MYIKLNDLKTLYLVYKSVLQGSVLFSWSKVRQRYTLFSARPVVPDRHLLAQFIFSLHSWSFCHYVPSATLHLKYPLPNLRLFQRPVLWDGFSFALKFIGFCNTSRLTLLTVIAVWSPCVLMAFVYGEFSAINFFRYFFSLFLLPSP